MNIEHSILAQIPALRGKLTINEPLSPYTTLKVGGTAEVFFQPQDFDDLVLFLSHLPPHIVLTVLGEGSNMLIRDLGLLGVVVHMGREMAEVRVNGTTIYAQSGAKSGKVARTAREASLTGLEFLCGIPGSLGGALKMNAGAYGQEVVDTLKEVHVITREGKRKILTPSELKFSYRHCELPKGWLFEAAVFSLEKGEKAIIREKMREINKNRSISQPLNMPSSGSWFKNPDGKKAWQLIDEVGLRGFKVGYAQVSEKHSNFFVNTGKATATDFEQLSGIVYNKVEEKTGIKLEREVQIIGESKLNEVS